MTPEEAVHCYEHLPPEELFDKADKLREIIHPEKIVTYIVDRNINYTNVCVTRCKFCGFYRTQDSGDSYVLTDKQLEEKILETKKLGGVQILLQGGHHPKLDFDYYIQLIRFIKSFDIHLHGFSPPEIQHFSKIFKMSVREILEEFKKAGLDSIPGGGAEILVDDVRKKISPLKCSAGEWIMVMRTAHELNIPTTATMMFGHSETLKDRVGHLEKIRSLQAETGGFTAFIPWTYQPVSGGLSTNKAGSFIYLKTLALSRLYLDNIKNIQASWVTQGGKIAQFALRCGANDMGSTMLEENVVSAAGTRFEMSIEKIEHIISEAGFTPRQR